MGEEKVTSVTKTPPWLPKEQRRERMTVRLPSNTQPDQLLSVASTSEVNAWLARLTPSIRGLSQLKRGWKGPRSHPVSSDSVAKLLNVLLDIGAYVAPPPQLVALASGGVQAEWHYYDQILEVGVNADGEVFAFAGDDSGNSVFELEDTWFIPSDQHLVLRRHLFSLAERMEAGGVHEGLQ
jgi:hypothetical protein